MAKYTIPVGCLDDHPERIDLHDFQRMAQYRNPRQLGVYGLYADTTLDRYRDRSVAAMDRHPLRRFLVDAVVIQKGGNTCNNRVIGRPPRASRGNRPSS